MSQTLRVLACTSGALASIISLKKVYAKENIKSPELRVWMTGSKYSVPNGSLVDLERPTPICWFSESGVGSWSKITTGPNFGAALSSEGRTYIWAYNRESEAHIPPRLLDSAQKVKDIVATEEYIAILENNGSQVSLYNPVTMERVHTFSCPSNSWLRSNYFVSISAGRQHIALLDSQGQVWTAGDNSYGQCGRPLPKKERSFDRFNFYKENNLHKSFTDFSSITCVSKDASSVVCGGRHTVIVSKDGKSFSFGDDSKIQLGLGDTRSQDVPDYVPHSGMGRLDVELTDMAKLFQNTMPAVKYTFYDRHIRSRVTEMKMGETEEKVLGAILGDNFTILKIGDSGLMMACGENQQGQCGRGLNKQQQTFVPVKLPKNSKPIQVSCGTNHCVASLEDGSIYAWGGNGSGQLGTGNRAPSCPPVVIHKSKIRGPLIQDIITRIGKEPERSQEEIQEFIEERRRDSLKAEAMLTQDSRLPAPPTEPPTEKTESKMKQDLLSAIDRSRAELIMSPEEQSKWEPVSVHASFNNSILVLQQKQ
jgi:alpha-tubulin suppressor-like RCC1 family protein